MKELLERIQTEKKFILDERQELKSQNARLAEELTKEREARKSMKDSISITDEEKLDIVKRLKHMEVRLQHSDKPYQKESQAKTAEFREKILLQQKLQSKKEKLKHTEM